MSGNFNLNTFGADIGVEHKFFNRVLSQIAFGFRYLFLGKNAITVSADAFGIPLSFQLDITKYYDFIISARGMYEVNSLFSIGLEPSFRMGNFSSSADSNTTGLVQGQTAGECDFKGLGVGAVIAARF